MNNTRQTLRDFIERETLDEDRMQALLDMQPAPRRRWPLLASVGTATAALVTLLVIALLPPRLLEERIADEVVANHLLAQPAEVTGDAFGQVAAYFDKLKFKPVQPSLLQEQWTLTGGRYCSLLGHPAAQFHYRFGPDGSRHTLYQAPYDPDAYRTLPRLEESEPPKVVSMHGLDVAIWVEKGGLFALTDPPK